MSAGNGGESASGLGVSGGAKGDGGELGWSWVLLLSTFFLEGGGESASGGAKGNVGASQLWTRHAAHRSRDEH